MLAVSSHYTLPLAIGKAMNTQQNTVDFIRNYFFNTSVISKKE